MNASVGRLGSALRVSAPLAWLAVGAGIVGVAAVVAAATRLGMLELLLGLVLTGLATLVGLRWPIVPLIAFATLIPIEEVVLIDGLGTISRFAGILFAVTYGVGRLGRLAFGAMPLAAWAYIAWALVSVFWAVDTDAAWAQLQTLLQLFLIAVLVADFVLQRPAIVRPVLWAYSISATATAFIGIQAYVATGLGADARAAAIQNQNPAQFAAVLLPALVFGLYELLEGQRRALGGLIATVTSIGVVVSGTRGAWLAVVVVLLLFILPHLTPRRRVVAIGAALGLLVIAFQVPGVADLVAERTETAVSTGGAGRTDIWSVALTIYQSAPVFGVGFSNFPIAYTADVVRASDVSAWDRLQGRAPHNIVLGTIVELGPIGLALLALFILPLVLRKGWGPDAATIQAALASLLTLALFLDLLANRKQIWLVIGLAAGLAAVARRKRQEQDPGPIVHSVTPTNSAVRAAVDGRARVPTGPP